MSEQSIGRKTGGLPKGAAGWKTVTEPEQPAAAPAPPTPAPPLATLTKAENQQPETMEPFADPPACATVGLPVRYCDREGTVVPAVLQSQPRTDRTSWNVRIYPETMLASIVRPAVKYSAEPRAGCWSLLPTTP